ncbi:hypothetical protein BHE74_00031169 [Ensete ventricosum]|nr:hypothetical protein BHE74_00031169 [Ensete ventricosum]
MFNPRSIISSDTGRYGRYILVHQQIDTRTAHYQAVPPIGVVSVSLLPEINRKQSISTIVARSYTVSTEEEGGEPRDPTLLSLDDPNRSPPSVAEISPPPRLRR